MQAIRFNTKDRPEFVRVLHKRVNAYFKENGITRHANLSMKLKTVFFVTLYLAPLVLMLTGVTASVWWNMVMWVLMGLGMSGIGLSIMHDANHGSYSRKQNVNKALGWLLSFVGGFPMNWRIQHNVLHHSFTNVEGHDEDIELNAMRFSPSQKRRWVHRFQLFYAPILYSIMTLYWMSVKDFDQIFRYKKKDLLKSQGYTFKKALSQVIVTKLLYFFVLIVLPLWLIDLPWWQSLLGFVAMHLICGLILALIFQVAHVIEETEFVKTETGSLENNWAIHQMKTTANFANRSRVFSWLIGGLNFQIEHHLFPNICHVHYRKISKIVQETAREFNVPYHHHRTWAGALKSHFKVLHQLGTGKYDRNFKTA
ncbi:MAG: fatty acid desaturase family protein [Flavobacteriales bacterium]